MATGVALDPVWGIVLPSSSPMINERLGLLYSIFEFFGVGCLTVRLFSSSPDWFTASITLAGNAFSGTFLFESILTLVAHHCTGVKQINVDKSGLVVQGSIPSIGLKQLTYLDRTKTELLL